MTPEGCIHREGDTIVRREDKEWWHGKSDLEIVAYQLFEDRLQMPFTIFHMAVERVLGRPVWVHEFGSPGVLREEFHKKVTNH